MPPALSKSIVLSDLKSKSPVLFKASKDGVPDNLRYQKRNNMDLTSEKNKDLNNALNIVRAQDEGRN